MVFCLVLAGALVLRAGYIQLWNNPKLDQMSRKQFQSKVLIRPPRGAIIDRNGEPLAVNIEAQSLAANPLKIRNRRVLARLLSKALSEASGVPCQSLLRKFAEKKEFVWIKRHLSESEMNRLRKFKIIDGDGDLAQGLWLVKENGRVYPHGKLAAHVLGEVNIDSEGVEGVELWMNDRMRGRVVSVSAIKDALGRPSFIDALAARRVQEGETIQLTLDASLQFAVEELLKASVAKHGARAGSVIVMNAENGEVLAMANEPSFNPNVSSGGNPERRRNRVLTDGYEPGSTLKAVLIASALSHGWKLTDQVYGERGQFKVQGKRIDEAETKEKFGWINLKKIIQYSSNIGAAKVALKLGADHYLATLKSFGFGAKTGIGFPGEISGRIPPRKKWQPLTLANIGFGQGILVTPMQMIRAYAAFLNGGYLLTPTLIKSPAFEQAAPKRVISARVANAVITALEGVTQDPGTGVTAALDGYEVAGKTGTAQEVDPATGAYSRTKHDSSFIGFAVEVQPKIVILTSLDQPPGLYYSSDTAAPLFHDVLNAVANRFSLPSKTVQLAGVGRSTERTHGSQAQDRVSISQANPVPVSTRPEPLKWQGTTATGTMIWTTPSFEGLTAREAMNFLRGHDFKLKMRGAGVVRGQSPRQGEPLAEGGTIRLSLGDP